MIVDRVLGAAADLEQPLDHWHDPSLEPNWAYKHPAEIDSTIPLEEIIEADRDARQHVEDMRKEREEFKEEFGDREDTRTLLRMHRRLPLRVPHDGRGALQVRRGGTRDRPRHEKPQESSETASTSTRTASSASTLQTTSTTPNPFDT